MISKPCVPSRSSQPVNPVLAGILQRSTQSDCGTGPKQSTSQQAIARSAVGRGIRHSFMAFSQPREDPQSSVSECASSTTAIVAATTTAIAPPTATASSTSTTSTANSGDSSSGNVQGSSQPLDSLSQLASNFQNSLNDLRPPSVIDDALVPSHGSFLSPTSSLIDLAMIPVLEETEEVNVTNTVEEKPPPPSSTTDEGYGWNFVDFPYPEIVPTTTDNQRKEEENMQGTA